MIDTEVRTVHKGRQCTVVHRPGWTVTEVTVKDGEYVRTCCERDGVTIYHLGDMVRYKFWTVGDARDQAERRARALIDALGTGERVYWADGSVRVQVPL